MTQARSTADVVIIGGGILGAATAFELSARGHHIVLLERGAINREGSGTTAGNLHIQAVHSRRPGQSVPMDVGRFLPLQRASWTFWESIEDELGTTVELRRNGGFMIAETEDQVAQLQAKHRLEKAVGLPTEMINGDEARRRLPLLSGTVLGADYCPLDGYANPLLVTPAYLSGAVRHGAVVHTYTPVTSVVRRGSDYRVFSTDQVWSAPVVVNVAGPWIAEVAALSGLNIAMAPVAIQLLVTERTAPVLRYLVQHIGEGLSVKQVSAGQILVGGGWPARHYNRHGRSPISFESAAGNAGQAVRLLPFLAGLRLLRAWAGPLAATSDEMPVIGSPPDEPGYLVAGGTYAFTLAPLWARCLRALIEGTVPPVDLAGLGLDRLLSSETLELQHD